MSTALQPKELVEVPISADGPSKKSSQGKTVEETYKKVSQREHVLLRPDAYIGSAVRTQQPPVYCWDAASERMVQRDLTFAPGIFKIFDEILVNAADHKQRCSDMKNLRVEIEPENCRIAVWNDGAGIPIKMHEEEGVYVPELIFGHLLTSSNYDDGEKKVVGGRNGFGAKLANIFSTQFVVETADSNTGLKYKQVFRDHMSVIGKPQITKATKKKDDWTRITFFPDLALFGMDSLDDDLVALLTKRVYDIAGTNPGVRVSLNGTRLTVKSFKDYIALYHGPNPEVPFVHQRCSDRWEIAIGASQGVLEQVSFVNSIWTIKGGAHVAHVVDQVVSKIQEHIAKKNKGMKLKPHQIKSHLSVFVNALIENPAFDSQTKETLTTKPSQFGSKCVISDDVFKRVLKSGVVENVLAFAKFKQDKELTKSDGGKKVRVVGVPKLDDANKAGGREASKCTLILTEGDSAKALAVSGLSVIGRDYYGVFPLRGKLLNVREASHKQIMDNAEISNLKKILGLQQGKKYSAENIKSLRYGHVLIMTDQDHDGSHIKGLLINFFNHFWPALLQIDGFLQEFITPIVKCVKGKSQKVFFTMPEYHQWIEAAGTGWKAKYYKGLGTSTASEAKSYFANLCDHLLKFTWSGEEDGQMIELAFAKSKVNERKTWLTAYVPGTYFNHAVDELNFSNFINKELILFSIADNARSIPSVVDGLKPSQRKVLFACFKRKLSKREIKVAQLAGYVSEHAAYHHGEASLQATILGLAQNFVGSNNANLLVPDGQFGTRLQGGKDAASSRYIFTKLAPVARALFPEADDPLLKYLEDDGLSIEPDWYCPVIPLVLLNGADGIGTGWSSQVPCYNPRDLVSNMRRMIGGEMPHSLIPWYRGFTGSVVPVGNSKSYDVYGAVFQGESSDSFRIRELPVRSWTTPFKEFLEAQTVGTGEAGKGHFVKEFTDQGTENKVSFDVTLTSAAAAELKPGEIHKKLKLCGSVATSNMMLFDAAGRINKYDDTTSIFSEFFGIRMELYKKRRAFILQELQRDLDCLDNKQRFVLMVIDGKLKVAKRKKSAIIADLVRHGFSRSFSAPSDGDESDGEASPGESSSSLSSTSAVAKELTNPRSKDFDYLLSLPLWSLTMERVEKLCSERDLKAAERDEMERTSAADLWKKDLDHLEAVLADEEVRANKESAELAAAAREARRKQTGGRGKRRADIETQTDVDFDDLIAPPSARTEKIRQPRKPKELPKLTKNLSSSSQGRDDITKTGKPRTSKKIVLDDNDSDASFEEDFPEAQSSCEFEEEDNCGPKETAVAAKKKKAARSPEPVVNIRGANPSESESEEEQLSLAQRLAQRSRDVGDLPSATSPSSPAPISKRPRPKGKAVPDGSDNILSPSPCQKKKKSRVKSPLAVKSKKKAPVASSKAPPPKPRGRARKQVTGDEKDTETKDNCVLRSRRATKKAIIVDLDSDDSDEVEENESDFNSFSSDFEDNDDDDSDF